MIDDALTFIRQHHRGVLATRRRDGRPQLSPVTATVDDGRVVVSSTEDRAKVRNLRADPRTSYCALTDGFFGAWAQVDGRAEVISLPDAMELLVRYYRGISGEHPDWDDYRAAMTRDRRCLVAITVEDAVVVGRS